MSGSDRVELIWADGAITQKWLEVIVKGTADTGLAANDVFFFGNEIGDTGASNTATSPRYVVRHHRRPEPRGGPQSQYSDYQPLRLQQGWSGHCGRSTIAQTHGTTDKTGLSFLRLGSPGPFAPRRHWMAIAARLPLGKSTAESLRPWRRAQSSSSQSLPAIPPLVTNRLEHLDLGEAPIAKYLEQLAATGGPHDREIPTQIDQLADELELHDLLLDTVLAKLGLE